MTNANRSVEHTRSGRVPELDLLRFVAAVAVVMYHLTYQPRLHGVLSMNAFWPFPAVTRYGYLGVTLFFMISGFVILWSSQNRSASEFVVTRISRLYPSFWVCIAITTLTVDATGMTGSISLRTATTNLTMIPGLLGASYVDGVYWTLFVELKFYFLVFIILATRTMAWVEVWLALWLVASVACAAGIAPKWVGSLAMYPYSSYFIAGCLFYLLRTKGISAFRVGGLLLTCALGSAYAIAQQSSFMSETSRGSAIVVAATVVVLFGLFAGICLSSGLLPASRWWYWLGSLTYPLYLLHNRISKELAATTLGLWSPWQLLVVQLAVALGLASVVALVIERNACSGVQRFLMGLATRVKIVRTRELSRSNS
jgi:peptidoglycan/LPS O-acetylase OafA/YrhL